MRRDFLPRSDSGLVSWTRGLALVTAEEPERYHLSPDEVASYVVLQAQYALAYEHSRKPSTASRAATALKRDVRKLLVKETRRIARVIRGAGVSSEALTQLGMPVPARRRQRVPAPVEAPVLSVITWIGGTLCVDLASRDHFGRARPANALGALVVMAPAKGPRAGFPPLIGGPGGEFVTTTTRRRVRLSPDIAPDNGRFWVSAAWLGSRLQVGIWSTPVECRVPSRLSLEG